MQHRPPFVVLAAALVAVTALPRSAAASALKGSSAPVDADDVDEIKTTTTTTNVGSFLGAGSAPDVGFTRRLLSQQEKTDKTVRFLQQDPSCSGDDNRFPDDEVNWKGRCLGWINGDTTKTYPDDFVATNGNPITSDVRMFDCPVSNKRYIFSNGIPDHDQTPGMNVPCEFFRKITLPLTPTLLPEVDAREPGAFGTIGVALNGVVIYGALELSDDNAVEGGGNVPDAQYWYGHAALSKAEHYHNPGVGHEQTPDEDTLLGYAMDGFPIYGPVESPGRQLDDCNGREVDDGEGGYRYHVRTVDQVDETLDYCDVNKRGAVTGTVNWKYIVGCFRGTPDETVVEGWDGVSSPAENLAGIDSDCVRVGNS